MRRSVSVRNCGGKDKKSTTKAPKLRSSSRIIDQHLKGNMPVYNIIARRHKVNSSLHKLSCHFLFLKSLSHTFIHTCTLHCSWCHNIFDTLRLPIVCTFIHTKQLDLSTINISQKSSQYKSEIRNKLWSTVLFSGGLFTSLNDDNVIYRTPIAWNVAFLLYV